MTEFALENVKLIMLFALIGSVIGLSHLNANKMAKLKSALTGQLWRGIGRCNWSALYAPLLCPASNFRRALSIAARFLRAQRLSPLTGSSSERPSLVSS